MWNVSQDYIMGGIPKHLNFRRNPEFCENTDSDSHNK